MTDLTMNKIGRLRRFDLNLRFDNDCSSLFPDSVTGVK